MEEILRRREIILEGQKQALELAMNGRELTDVLDALTQCVERQSTGPTFAAMFLLYPDGNKLIQGSAPNVPADYVDAIVGQPIDPPTSVSQAAALSAKEVIVTDIAVDLLMESHRDKLLAQGIQSCWSVPILSSSQQVLATFDVYYGKQQQPTHDDYGAVELLGRTAAIIIEWFSAMERRRAVEEALHSSDQHWQALMSATTDMLYRMSADWHTALTLNGQSFLSEVRAEVPNWQEKMLLPEDRDYVKGAIDYAIANKSAYELEHRYLRGDGSVGWTLSRAIPILDEKGEIVEWYGVASDITSRKRYEHSLSEALSLLEAVFKNSPVGYALFNDEHQYLQVNESLARMNGPSPNEHVGKHVRDILPESFRYLEDVLTDIFRTGKTRRNVEIRGPVAANPDTVGTWLATFYPIIVEGSPTVKYVGAAVLEITERIQAEEALKESEKQFRDFSNSIQNLAWMARPDGWVYWYNQRWYDYTGSDPDIVEGWGWMTVYHPDHVTQAQAFVIDAWQRAEEWELTAPLRRRDGEYQWFLTRAYPVKDEQGNVTKWIGTSTDIHDKWMVQEELRRSEDRLREVLNFMPQIVWSAGPDGHHDFFNERWYTFTGRPPGSIAENPWREVLHPDDYDRMQAIWRRCLLSGDAYEIEYRMRRHDGVHRWMLARAMPLRRSDSSVERWFGTCTDIHDQKTMAENLETLVLERTKELQRSNEDLQQFAHVASHDFKEPVRKIKLFADLIYDRYADQLPDAVNRNIAKIQKSARRIASMIEGVLLYASLDGASLALEDVNLNTLISEVEEDLDLVIAEKQATITCDILPVIQAVPELAYQLFYNIIRNALKFSHPDRLPHVHVTSELISREGKTFYKISISDNGIGFNNAYAESIFVAFTRLHTKDIYEGTGIGLALCKKIVERHGGTIRASGKEGEGAVFEILWGG